MCPTCSCIPGPSLAEHQWDSVSLCQGDLSLDVSGWGIKPDWLHFLGEFKWKIPFYVYYVYITPTIAAFISSTMCLIFDHACILNVMSTLKEFLMASKVKLSK